MEHKIFLLYTMRLQNNFKTTSIPGDGAVDVRRFWGASHKKIKSVLQGALDELGSLKASILVQVTLEKDGEHADAMLRSKSLIILQSTNINNALKGALEEILESLAKYTREGSGWVEEEVLSIDISTARYVLIKGGSYNPLPVWIQRKHAIVNVRNNDNKCFQWAIRSALYPVEKNPERPSKYPTDDLDWSGGEFPVPITGIDEFEENNNLAINVYGEREQTIVPLRISKSTGERIHLFYYAGHYSWVKSPSRLFYKVTKHKTRKHFCDCCLQQFATPKALKEHNRICMGVEEVAQRIQMPMDKNLFYNDHRRQLQIPYVIYADFEALITKESKTSGKTEKKGLHEICSFGYVVVRCDGHAEEPVLYRGKNAANKLLRELEKEEEWIREQLRHPKKNKYSKEDKRNFERAKNCHICQETLLQYGRQAKKAWDEDGNYLGEAHLKCGKYKRKGKGASGKPSTHCIHCKKAFEEDFYMDKVRDHCHITGDYKDAAHWRCSFKIDPEMEIPVFFHNLRGYDSHLLLQGTDGSNVKCIPNNKERYMSVTVGKLKFLDSMQFMADSLDNLVKYNKGNLPITQEFDLEMQKGVYPYEYMDSWEKFLEPQLPPLEAFYSTLNECGINTEDYQRAQEVWKKYDCKNLGDYHDIYLYSDVTQLADVFQNFRRMCMEYYDLDPANFYTAPGLSWSALLKKTNAQLDLLTDYGMYRFIEDGIRGGVCGPSKRYAKANNPLVGHDPSRPNTYLWYLDANNLYGWAMSQYLPVRDFQWVEDTGKIEDYLDIPKDADQGYILEVDLEYPPDIHDLHNDYPMAPEVREIPFTQLSPLQKKICPGYKSYRKLTMNLMNKKNYVVHYRNLQFYVRHGLRVTKIHRVLKFTQEPWMRSYIDFNTQKRTQAKNDFEKNLFKLMNNSVFGKTMENIRKRVNIKIAADREEAESYVSQPGFVRYVEMLDFYVIHMKKANLFLNKPIYTGFAVLDLSKLLMYEFYYDKLKPKYGDNCHLLYTDTDSLILEITTEDVYRDCLPDIDEYDTSEYPKDHFLYDPKNKKVIGKMKDEMKGNPILEYAGLRPKMYSVRSVEKGKTKDSKKAKGVKKYVVKKNINHELYLKVLQTQEEEKHKMNSLRSYGHQIHNITQEKVSLSAFDSKRWMCDDGINTIAFGHHTISSSSLTNPRVGPS